MLKQIIDNNTNLNKAEVVAICKWKDNLCAIPCINAMSGYYPDYKESVVIKENIEDLYGDIEALLLVKTTKNWDVYEVVLATDSWDGFQPVLVENLNDVVEFIKWLAMYI